MPILSFLMLLLKQYFFLFEQEVISLQFKANKLDKKDFFGKSDPYLEFQRSNEDGR